MIVALNRDGQFKVESITDEFVTLDTNTKTNVMAKLDAIVEGDMDETYLYKETNVNVNSKKKKKKKGKNDDDDDGEDDGDKKKKGKKRAASTSSGTSGNAAKKRKTSVKK